MLNKSEKPRLFPEHFPVGQISGSECDFTKGKISMPRGGEDPLEYWYTEDPEESEYLNEEFQRNIELKIELLQKEGWNPVKQKFWATTQSHLDLGWMWQFRQGVAKAERTLAKAHEHFKLFKPFTFTGSQPAQYQWVKYNSPEIWDKILVDVASGRHELQGGCWSEADGRMPSGEAWVRQRLYGQLFYARNFGKIANIEWFPDSFGYADNMSQIFARSGAEGFMTAKLTSNKQTKWPFWAWWWEGPDGSKLLSYLSGNHNKLGPLGGFDVPQRDSDVRESYVKSYRLLKPGTELRINYEQDKPEEHPNVSDDELPIIACFFGEGDGGHGPQGVEMATYRGFAERGHVKWASTAEIFAELATYAERLPVWKDELYYQFHRGSLTTQAMMKRMNRKYEWTLPVIEGLYALITTLKPGAWTSYNSFYTDPKDQIPTADNPIEQMWQNCCLMQFHDVLPGTSIPEVYDECFEFWSQDTTLMDRLKTEAIQELKTALQIDGKKEEKGMIQGENLYYHLIPIVIANSSGAEGERLIELPVHARDDMIPIAFFFNSQIYPIQTVDADKIGFILDRKPDRIVFPLNIPAWTAGVGEMFAISSSLNAKIDINTLKSIQNIILDKTNQENMGIVTQNHQTKIKSKELAIIISNDTGYLDQILFKGIELLKNPAKIQAYIDKPKDEFCWNLMPNWWDFPKTEFFHKPEISIQEQGPVRHVVRVTQTFGNASKALIDYTMYANIPGFGIEIALDFHETETLLKFELPFSINSQDTIAETPYSTCRRKNNPIANHDVARWEKWMHTFVTIEDELKKMGCAVINEGKYGFDTKNERLGISLVRGAQYPGANVVAWVKETRKARKDAGLGEPPTHTDQGEHLIRLWILPYEGSWQDGQVHAFAHAFNAPVVAQMFPTTDSFEIKQAEKTLKSISQDAIVHQQQWQFIATSNPTIEITAFKPGEQIPEFMNPDHLPRGLVLRVVNNLNVNNSGSLRISPLILKGAKNIIEVDLLERSLPNGFKTIIQTENSSLFEISLSLKPHEIRTFKIY
jgi:alpha-mannosidase